MIKRENVLTIYIGDKDPQSWLQDTGKSVLMPVLLKTAEAIISEGLEEKQAARVETLIRGKKKALDFFVRRDSIYETIDKVMEWALQEEEYEMCTEIKNLKEKLQNEDFSDWG